MTEELKAIFKETKTHESKESFKERINRKKAKDVDAQNRNQNEKKNRDRKAQAQ